MVDFHQLFISFHGLLCYNALSKQRKKIYMVEIHKIRRSRDGLFSKGGQSCNNGDWRWAKKGKTWNTSGTISSHLSQYATIPADWEVVSYFVEEDGSSKVETKSAVIWAAELAVRRNKRTEARDKRIEAKELELLKQQIVSTQLKLDKLTSLRAKSLQK